MKVAFSVVVLCLSSVLGGPLARAADGTELSNSTLLSDVPVGSVLKFRRPLRFARGALLTHSHHRATGHICHIAVSYFNFRTMTHVDEEAHRGIVDRLQRIVLGEGEFEEFTVTEAYVTRTTHVLLENPRGVNLEIWCSEGVSIGQFAAMYSSRPYFLAEGN